MPESQGPPVRSIPCRSCGSRADYSGEHPLGGAQFTCGVCRVTVTPSDTELAALGGLQWREWVRGEAGNDSEGYWQEWFCDVPDNGARFTVLRDEWAGDYTVRRIFEVRLAED